MTHTPGGPTSTRITIGGREYASADEMPPEDRARYDAFLKIRDQVRQSPGAATSDRGTMSVRRSTLGEVTSISVDGHDYRHVEEMPPEHRARYEQFLKDFDPALFSHLTDTPMDTITINGRSYRNEDEMTPEDRALYRQFKALAPASGRTQTTATPRAESARASDRPISSSSVHRTRRSGSVVQPDGVGAGNRWIWGILILAAVGLVVYRFAGG